MEKYIIFQMPDIFIKKLGFQDYGSFMHTYIVTDKGRLMVPWFDLIDQDSDIDDFSYSIINNIEYFDADDLMQYVSDKQKNMMMNLIYMLADLHESRFDFEQKNGQS